MIEPYLLDMALEVLKIIGGVLIPVLTMLGMTYKRKFERQFKKNEIEKEIARYTQWASKLQSFETMDTESKKQTIMKDITPFVIDMDINISNTELELMIEKALTMPKSLKYRLLKEAKDGLVQRTIE